MAVFLLESISNYYTNTSDLASLARNALDCIEYVRELKKLGVSVFFENDGIDTESMNHELVLYIKSAFAQEEFLSNSKRVRRSNQMRMETGTFTFLNAPFGFRIEDDTLLVPYIFRLKKSLVF